MGKYLTYEERFYIEKSLKDNTDPKKIAKTLGKHFTTIYKEIEKGTVTFMNSDLTYRQEYCADAAQRITEERGHNKGIMYKLANDKPLLSRIAMLIKDKHYSPYAVLQTIKKETPEALSMCETTLYKYIHLGLIPGVSDADLYIKANKKPKKKKEKETRSCFKKPPEKSIIYRPEDISNRETYGHWEVDTVYSGSNCKSKTALLVLTERKTLEEYYIRMADRTLASVISAFDDLEKHMGLEAFQKKFKTMTADNGSEFGDGSQIERSATILGQTRTQVFFCHPYSSYERGQNENQNRFVRRWVKKGGDLSAYTPEEWEQITEWVNNYPRRKYNGMSAREYKESLDIA
ncbi:MAG: IS30 family transposase [Lachnospiraceae bacterium]|nr:IS30 family transposase [Lachnospiraceae bacterium]